MVCDQIHRLGSRNVFGDRLGSDLTGLSGSCPWLSQYCSWASWHAVPLVKNPAHSVAQHADACQMEAAMYDCCRSCRSDKIG